jgi:hypothetical protein
VHHHPPDQRTFRLDLPDRVEGMLDGQHLHQRRNRQGTDSGKGHAFGTMGGLAEVFRDHGTAFSAAG